MPKQNTQTAVTRFPIGISCSPLECAMKKTRFDIVVQVVQLFPDFQKL